MITRSDVQRVIDAFILEETLYWWLHPIEQVLTVRGIDAWDGYHWTLARQLAQDESLKAYMDTLGEMYLRENMEYLVQSASPRLYHEYWTACPAEEGEEDTPPNDPDFVKNGRGIMTAKIGYKLGRDKWYKRMGAKGATGRYRRLPRPWER